MNDPRSEISGIVKELTAVKTPAALRETVYKYFDHNAGFDHFVCSVLPGPNSRESILGVYQWYRDMSPGTQAEVQSLVYDEDKKVAYMDVVQLFHISLSPFKPRPARLIVKLTLKQSQTDGKYYIVYQEDAFQPEDMLSMTLPFLAPPVMVAKRFAGQACYFNAAVFAVLRSYIHHGMTLVGLRGGSAGENNASKEA
ncbi:hypothetical protein M0805_008994 [Coniferiporia weirii]|nr:hypothetical protein M0805_008994 [Coniferiporia weirii]